MLNYVQYTFLGFLCLFEVGSVICGAAQSSSMLIVGRAVAGMGGSGLSNGALTILSAMAPIHKRATLLGIMMSSEFLN
jgi:predicted MFS family arabinose efflux permease